MKPTIRASEMDRVLSCNGSLTLIPMVNARTGDEGYEGSQIHWMIADRLIRELGATPPEGGLKPPDVPSDYKLPSFSLWIVDWAVRHVRDTIPTDWSLQVEVPLAYEYDRWILSGHHDLLAMSPDGLRSMGKDWKTGYSIVDEAGSNWQVASYVALSKSAWPDLIESQFEICQPRADEDEGFQRVSETVIKGDRLERLGPTLDSNVIGALANPMEVNTGIKQCAFCPAAMQCPAAIELRELMKATLTPELLASIKATPDDAALGEWVMAAQSLDKPMEDAKRLLKDRIKLNGSATAADGTRITIKTQGGSYSFPDPVAFYRETRKLLQSDEVYAATVKPSVSKTIDALAEVLDLPKTSKAGPSARSTFDGALRPLCEQGTKEILVYS